jgi:hypothetical protein
MKFDLRQLLAALTALLVSICSSLEVILETRPLNPSCQKPIKAAKVHEPNNIGITDFSTYKAPPPAKKPNMMSLGGHLFRINYGVPKHIMKVFLKLYKNDEIRYEDIPAALLKYELKGDDIPEDLREEYQSKGTGGTSVKEDSKLEL